MGEKIGKYSEIIELTIKSLTLWGSAASYANGWEFPECSFEEWIYNHQKWGVSESGEPHCNIEAFDSRLSEVPPFFVHPRNLHDGLWKTSLPEGDRPVRVDFFGSHDREFYDRHFHFPMLSRTPIIESLLASVPGGDSLRERASHRLGRSSYCRGHRYSTRRPDWKKSPNHGGLLCRLEMLLFPPVPPGWCMPVSHNLIEAMMCGAIPILNHPESLEPPLCDGVNCLAFRYLEGFKAQIRAALEMSAEQFQGMRCGVSGYYEMFLAPMTFRMALSASISDVLVMNAQEKSMPLRYRNFSWKNESLDSAIANRL